MLILDGRPLWAAQTNCYVIASAPGEPAIIVDAPPDREAVAEMLAKHDLAAAALALTHGHVDHMGGAGGVADRTGAAVYMHPDDDWLAADPREQMTWFFGMASDDVRMPETYNELSDGEVLGIGGLSLEVLHTPGHTPGHCCFHLPDEGLLFSGDQLFAGSIGRWDLPGGDYETLMGSMEAKVLPLPQETEVLPGHGPRTTLAKERAGNPFLLELLR